MNRRSILSTLCTGALALLAPVVALAKPCRWVGFHNRGVKPMVITPRAETTTGPPPRSQEQEWILPKPLGKENAELRALLAEARDMIYENVMVRRFRIGTGEATYEGYLQDTLAQADLHTRIDDALK